MKHIYLKRLSLTMVVALGLISCNKQAEPENIIPKTSDSTDKITVETTQESSSSTLSKNENIQSNQMEMVAVSQEKKHATTTLQSSSKDYDINKKEDRKIKGIEEIALYREQIAKEIGEEKPTYKKGYLVSEFNKAKENYSKIAGKLKTGYSVQFQERGPANVPGRARAIMVNPNNLDNWFIGSAGGGIWETVDGGTTWFNNTDTTLPNLATPSIASPKSNPNVLYAGTGEPYGNLDAVGGFGVVKSTNGGDSWEYLTSSSMMGDVGRIVVDPNNENTVVVATVTGIYKTVDGGQNWTKTKSSGYFQDLVHEPENYNVMYASEKGEGIFKSVDMGDTWNLVFKASDFNANIGRMEIDVSPVNTNKVVIGAYQSGSTGYYLSNDAGATFTKLNVKSGSDGSILSGQGWYDNALAFHPLNENIFYSGGVYMAKVTIDPSNNTFSTQPIAGGYGDVSGQINRNVHVDMQDITYVMNPNDANEFKLILVCDGGVYSTQYETDPGATEGDWSNAAVGMNSTQFYGADKKNGEDKYVAGAQDNGSWVSRTVNPNQTAVYTRLLGGDGFKSIWNYEDPTRVMVSSQFNNLASLNYTTGYGSYVNHPDRGSGGSPFYSKISNVNNNPNVVFSPSKNGVWRTPDFGLTWELASINAKWTPNNSAPSALEVESSVANPNIVWAGAAMTESASYTPHISTDNGISFTPTNTFTDPRANYTHNYYFSDLATSSVNENRAYILFSGDKGAKVLRTNDRGQNWEDISGFSLDEDRGFPNVAVHALLEMPFDENIIWVGTDIGIFETIDGGNSWHIVNDFLPVSVFDLKYVNDEVVISTHGRGVWSATIPELLNFELPTYVNPPKVLGLSQAGIHDMRAKIKYKYTSPAIESISVYIDGTFVTDITSGIAPPNQTLTYIVEQDYAEGLHTVELQGNYGSNKTVKDSKQGTFIMFNDGKPNYKIEEFTTEDILSLGDHKFVVDNASGKFPYNVLNNEGHPYANSAEYITYLKTPFINTAEGILKLTHIAITEGGYDYAIVEASKDLEEWVSIAQYTETSYSDWSGATPAQVNESLFKSSALDFNNKFAVDEEVVIRLRLTTDVYETRYGWVIKSLVNEDKLAVTDVTLEASTSTAKISPNPVEKNVNIFLSNKNIDKANVDIYDLTGRLISSYKDVSPMSGVISIPFKKLRPGNYVAVIKTDDFTKSINFIKK